MVCMYVCPFCPSQTISLTCLNQIWRKGIKHTVFLHEVNWLNSLWAKACDVSWLLTWDPPPTHGRVFFCMSKLWKKCSHVRERQEQGKPVAKGGDSTGWVMAATLVGQSSTAPRLNEQSWKVKRQQPGLRSFLESQTWTRGRSWGQAQLWHSSGWAWRPGLELRWSPWAMGSRWGEIPATDRKSPGNRCCYLCCQHRCLFSTRACIRRCFYNKPRNILYFFHRTLNRIISGGCCFW